MNHAIEVPIIAFQYLFNTKPYGMRSFIACLTYCSESSIRRRKKSSATGIINPIPKLTLQTPSLSSCPYATRTIITTIPAATKPASTAKQVAKADNIPRFPRTVWLSFVASVVVVAQVGYSPASNKASQSAYRIKKGQSLTNLQRQTQQLPSQRSSSKTCPHSSRRMPQSSGQSPEPRKP
jgi:hypothetical protein